MPAYFTMTIQRKADRLTADYVEQVYTTIIEAGYPFKSGFWPHQDAAYDEIVACNQAKLTQGYRRAFTKHVSHDYMQILFNAPEYCEKRGFWTYSETGICFNLIIPESNILNYEGGDIVLEHKIAPIRAIGVKMREKELAEVIQTSVEMDAGYYSIDQVFNGKNVMAHPFAIIPKDVVARFSDTYLAFLCATDGVQLSVFFQKKLGAGMFGGEGFILQKVTGPGTVFFEIDGYCHEYDLNPGEEVVCDTGVLALMDATCQMDVRIVKGIKNKLFGGEGLVDTVITGPGKVYLQTMSIPKIAGLIIPYLPNKK